MAHRTEDVAVVGLPEVVVMSKGAPPARSAFAGTAGPPLHHVNASLVRAGYAVIVAFICVLWGWMSANLDGDLWESWPQATCMPDECFCEAPRPNTLIRQPANTWSNLAFVLVGMYVLSLGTYGRAFRSSPPPSALFGKMSVCFAVGCAIEGMGSFFYHQSLTYAGQWFDNLGMYLSLSAFALYELVHLNVFSERVYVQAYIAANAAFGYMLWVYPDLRRVNFTILMVTTVGTIAVVGVKQRPRINYWYLATALTLFLVAFAIWELDLRHVWCNPASLLQGHALWHIMCAAAQLSAWFFFQSEDAQ